MKKRGISPVIATVLLIAIVLVIALIVFMWFRGLIQEANTKFDGENIELACDDILFEAEYDDSAGEIAIQNLGGIVPIYEIKLKIIKTAGYDTKNLKDISDWPEIGLNPGGTFSGDISSVITSEVNEIILIPVLLGRTGNFDCGEQYGVKILV